MGIPLNLSNYHKFKRYLKYNKGYQQWRQNIERIKKMREHLEKPFDAVKKVREQYEAIGKRLRSSNFIAEQVLSEELKKAYGASVKFQQLVRTGDGKVRRPDFSIDGQHYEVKQGKIEPLKDDIVEGHGFHRYIKDKNIKDILDFPEHFLASKKGKAQQKYDFVVADYADALALAKSCGLNHVDFFDAICDIIKKKKSVLSKQRDLSDGVAVQQLITLYENKVAHNAEKKLGKYKLTDLYKSKDYKEWSQRTGFVFDTYKKFNHFWRDHIKPRMAKATKKH